MSKKKSLKSTSESFYQKTDFLGAFILIAYGFITVLTPNLNTLDSNGPKFLALALLNFIVFGIVLYAEKYRKHVIKFFTNPIGIAYSILMVFSLISFTQAINVSESIIHFSKIFTTFTATWLVSVIVFDNKNNLLPLAIAMSLLLIFDSFSVFSEISKYIKGELKSILLIKTVYSNKNILTSSIFIKIPFALWLMFFFKKRLRYLGIFTLFMASLAIFFMSSRAFYLASLVLIILVLLYGTVRFIQTKKNSHFLNAGIVTGVFLLSFTIFSFIEKNAYPKETREQRSVAGRLSTITTKKESNARLKIWNWAFQVYKESPILGVGLGNFKINVLKYENKTKPNYIYSYKVHNDFIETFVETGIFGGISFIAIFVFVLWYFAKVLLKNLEGDYLVWYFLVFFGMVGYFFDAFFNFPQDRPEIQALFALFLGATIGIRLNEKKQSNNTDN